MRPFQNSPGLRLPTDGEPTPGLLDSITRNGQDGTTRLVEAMATALAAVEERVGRLEGEMRNLQGQHSNRS